ncbi:YpjP family protein [Neobacillus kokaensis]|uniref:Cell division protein FtsK n=1 Tax=Neobacillus kokaensis TaxID=2759023 RepID=A0ABQ3N010_9BACI|nr:YpjP family protein [Neobacillus kokaensis]GHH98270.1 cell division protein FtsK [Neobacillus kokaensis]
MNKWLRKSLFVIVSILTFGLITPTQLMNTVNAENHTDRDAFEAPSVENSFTRKSSFKEESEFNKEDFMQELLKQAELQSYQKFGTRIKPVIENEFREIILPNIEAALAETAAQFPEEDLKNLTITEQPGKGLSEKIFNIKNGETGKDILRFHVRREHPPQDGYWFNFHYHTYHDEYQTHHDLGSIYWAKNTPPKWMS